MEEGNGNILINGVKTSLWEVERKNLKRAISTSGGWAVINGIRVSHERCDALVGIGLDPLYNRHVVKL